MEEKKKYLLDTNVFNHVREGKINLERFLGCELFVTHHQMDEVLNTPGKDMRDEIISAFQAIGPKDIPTGVAVWGVSRWGRSNYGSSEHNKLYEKILEKIKLMDSRSKRRKLPENQVRDALVAVTAIQENLILVTNDLNLATAAREEGCEVVDWAIDVEPR